MDSSSGEKGKHTKASQSHANLSSIQDKEMGNVGMNRSHSVSVGVTPSHLNPKQEYTRSMYEELPMTVVHGMQTRETLLSRSLSQRKLSQANLASMEGALKGKGKILPFKSKSKGELESVDPNLLSDTEMEQVILTAPLIFAVLISTIVQFLVGYNTSVMNAPAEVVFPGHTDFVWSIVVSSFAVGGPGGAYLGGILANKRGRAGGLIMNAIIFLVGGLLLSLAPNIYWLIPARFIIGIASGSASVIVPIYLGEIAPPMWRGTLGTMTQFSMVIGILMSDLFAYPLATEKGWRYLFAFTPCLAGIMLLCSPFLLESPRWLLAKDENSHKARVIMKKFRGFRDKYEVETEIKHLMAASLKAKTDHSSAHSASALMSLFSDREVRLMLVSSIILQVAQQLCGVNAIFYYSTMFFKGLIDDPLTGTTLVAFINVLATYVALKCMDRAGRKTLTLISSFGMLFSCLLVTFSLMEIIPQVIALLAIMNFVFFFEIGLGPIPWLIVAEMFSQKYVATAMSLSSQVNWACNFLVGIGFPFLKNHLGVYCFFPFASILVVTIVFTYFYLPETLGKTPEEILEFVNRERHTKLLVQRMDFNKYGSIGHNSNNKKVNGSYQHLNNNNNNFGQQRTKTQNSHNYNLENTSLLSIPHPSMMMNRDNNFANSNQSRQINHSQWNGYNRLSTIETSGGLNESNGINGNNRILHEHGISHAMLNDSSSSLKFQK